MATITKITVNGNDEFATPEYENFRKALSAALTVKNPDAKTTRDAMSAAGITAEFATEMMDAYEVDTVVEISEVETGKDNAVISENLQARYTWGKMARRFLVILSADEWTGEIFTEKTGKKDTSPVTQVLPKFGKQNA